MTVISTYVLEYKLWNFCSSVQIKNIYLINDIYFYLMKK